MDTKDMHPNLPDNSPKDPNRHIPKGARLVFGVFMIIFYIVIGVLFCVNVFNIDNAAISAICGGILCAYGVWRGYRLFTGRQ